jgi:O-antigen ligase
MRPQPKTTYHSVAPSRKRRGEFAVQTAANVVQFASSASSVKQATGVSTESVSQSAPVKKLKSGHAFSYAALFAFTLVLYARPSDFYPSAITNSMALVIALTMLAFFIPTQLSLEGNLTAMLPEVRLVLLYGLIGLVGVPVAISRVDAWQEFSGVFIRCIIVFVVLVNVVRTEARLKALFYLSLATAAWLSVGAINDYRLGLLTVEGYRVAGHGLGIFGNSNDMALYLVTMVPIAITFLLRAKSIAVKAIFAATTLLMISAIMFTYSRGGFLGLVAALGFLGWRLGNRHRAQILAGGFLLLIAFLVLSPGGYGVRLASIVFPSLDLKGSADVRRGDLTRSLYVALRHPLFGIGMGNYASQMSFTGLVTHNSYTQVAAEMGLAALYCYTMFIVRPLRKLGSIARETFAARSKSPFHYLAVGLQASLIGYMVCSFFASVAYLWYVFYLVGYAVCLRRLYEAETGREVVVEKRAERKKAALLRNQQPLTT